MITHSLMHEYSESLDSLCQQLAVPKLSSFFDFTDLEYNFADDDDEDEEDEEEPQFDPETGLAYGIDAMQWFDSVQGIATLTALRSHLNQQGIAPLNDAGQQQLLEELDDCLEKLDAAKTAKFHLAVIM
jgi:hypothetical protein